MLPNVCAIDATPLLIEEDATQVGTPFTSARMKPFVPNPKRPAAKVGSV
jgi:hypothetical protein